MTGDIVARVSITGLLVLAFVVALVAAVSALRKWSAARTQRLEKARLQAVSREIGRRHDDATRELVQRSANGAEHEEVALRFQREREDAGLRSVTMGELDAEIQTSHIVIPDSFEAPREVWWGLVALISATVASIWDIWLA